MQRLTADPGTLRRCALSAVRHARGDEIAGIDEGRGLGAMARAYVFRFDGAAPGQEAEQRDALLAGREGRVAEGGSP